ncbi:alanine:cation symporter family protein [Oculatella sp. LEGE 06141]|uniref:alanine/glycine:cation symporter family protein n=1 Tax=Oculatella sp. LEGE 06141 TaxID=1828648 RepID=UPI00187ECD77|nr:alanine/glycine:cation symporter family protein [Oculatella sp. LEGE 06141]MBE9177574.1 alanine:cation symporter family protein [Oculatella sp. LEGE 06141]
MTQGWISSLVPPALFSMMLPLHSLLVLAQAPPEEPSGGFLAAIDAVFSQIVAVLDRILFVSIAGVPLVVLWLIGGAVFFTIRMGFINFRAFGHAIDVVRGKYDDPSEPGEVTHFQALSAALSATVGLGNIAGVAIAVSVGGPGAVFWMTIAGLLGMTSKFVECTLGLKYRIVRPDGTVAGGPMYYLSKGLSERGMRPLGQGLAVLFSILCIGGSLGGGNMFQANQSFVAVAEVIPLLQGRAWLYGLIMAALVALVIIGGIRRIGAVAGALVPAMCFVYVVASLWILLTNFTAIPAAFGTILVGAFSPQAMQGGFIGVLVQGVRRAAFSNEAGVGSAAIAHSAARTDEPVREGIVALLEPFIDTVVICNMTALVIVITGVYNTASEGVDGVQLTLNAFSSVISWFPLILALSVLLFAFSTIISWSYYGEQSWGYLFGRNTTLAYKVLFVSAVFVGAVVNLGAVLDFSDMMILSMAFPNMLGGFILSNQVAADLKDYMSRLQSGQMQPEAQRAKETTTF